MTAKIALNQSDKRISEQQRLQAELLRSDHVIILVIDALLAVHACVRRWMGGPGGLSPNSMTANFATSASRETKSILNPLPGDEGRDKSYRALAELDDGQISNLSAIGRQARQDARCAYSGPNLTAAMEKSMPLRLRRMLAVTARAASLMIAAAFSVNPGHGSEVRLLSAAAMQSVFKEIKEDFQGTSGYRLIIHYGTIGAVNDWIMGGEEVDLVIGSSQSMPALVKSRKINANSQTAICKTGIGVVVASGAEVRVTSVEDFKRALIAARAIVYADPVRGGAAGIHVAKVIEKLGLTEQLKPKLRLGAGGDITEVTLSLGPGALGITQISEIADKRDAQLAGPLPEEFQNYTVFIAGVPTTAAQSEGSAALLKFLRSPKAIAVIKAKGMEDFGSDGGSE